MKKTLHFFILLVFSNLLSAQSNTLATIQTSLAALSLDNTHVLTLNSPSAVGFSSDFETIEGGPYYQDEWLRGKMILKDGQILGNEWLFKYNIFQDELHIQLESGAVKIPIKNHIQAFMIEQDGKQHYFVNSAQAGIVGKDAKTFFEVLHSNKFTLLKQNSKHIGQVESNGFYCSSCENSPFSFFFVSEKYYVKDKKGQFRALKLKRKSILKAFPNQKTLILSYLKKNKVKTEAHLLALLQYLES